MMGDAQPTAGDIPAGLIEPNCRDAEDSGKVSVMIEGRAPLLQNRMVA